MTNAFVRPFLVALTASTSLLLIGCASNGSRGVDAGERISARGGAISARGEAWNDGQRDVAKGRKLVARSADRTTSGDKRLRRAQEDVTKAEREMQDAQSDRTSGEQLIANGTTQMQQAEAAYTDLRNGPSAIPPR